MIDLEFKSMGGGEYSAFCHPGLRGGLSVTLTLVRASKHMTRYYAIAIKGPDGEDALEGLVDRDDRYGLDLKDAKRRAAELVNKATEPRPADYPITGEVLKVVAKQYDWEDLLELGELRFTEKGEENLYFETKDGVKGFVKH